MKIAVVGGGAAGYFGAISAAEKSRHASVALFESTSAPLDKVRISGGGRCNVTHACFDPQDLSRSYPRGGRELIGPFTRFQPADTIKWFAQRGVRLKREDDGRMFPVTDNSATIVDCLQQAAIQAGVRIRHRSRVMHVRLDSDNDSQVRFGVDVADSGVERFDRVLLATGSSPQGYRIAQLLGHAITPRAPSLFTFKIKDPRIEGLSGLSSEHAVLAMDVEGKEFTQEGPVLITHWGLSGPAVLKLSAWGARCLKDSGYKGKLSINWLAGKTVENAVEVLSEFRETHPRRDIRTGGPDIIPKRLWERLVRHIGISDDTTWANLTKKQIRILGQTLTCDHYQIEGKGAFKEEFVTCGGVDLKEIDFKTMQSRVQDGLFFAGEILDIDGITGGFNFQAAWTTGWIAGQHIGT